MKLGVSAGACSAWGTSSYSFLVTASTPWQGLEFRRRIEVANGIRKRICGKADQPSAGEVAAVLGSASEVWNEFIHWMAEKEGVAGQEWKGIVVKKYGWSLRLKQRSRNIVCLKPGNGCFMVSFVLSDEALKQAKEAHPPKAVADALAAAPRYPEGNGLRLLVQRAGDLAAIRKIAAIKLAN